MSEVAIFAAFLAVIAVSGVIFHCLMNVATDIEPSDPKGDTVTTLFLLLLAWHVVTFGGFMLARVVLP